MRRKIPSTTALIAFEAAARHQSFTKAAEELDLTQSAICRQIAGLETFLDVELFSRSRRGVRLTETGQAYARRVASQLDIVERDVLAVMGPRGTRTIELAVVPTFGTRWLLPRLKDFQRQHPDITVNLTNRTRPFLFADTAFDAAIYFGDADWPGTQANILMHERLIPVCSPALLPGGRPLDNDSIMTLPLLQQTTRPYGWRQWFHSQGIDFPQAMNGPRYELFSMLAQAAIHEMGIALIPSFLIQQELESGQLTCAHSHSVSIPDKAYYLMIPQRKTELSALRTLQNWLTTEAHAYARAHTL